MEEAPNSLICKHVHHVSHFQDTVNTSGTSVTGYEMLRGRLQNASWQVTKCFVAGYKMLRGRSAPRAYPDLEK